MTKAAHIMEKLAKKKTLKQTLKGLSVLGAGLGGLAGGAAALSSSRKPKGKKKSEPKDSDKLRRAKKQIYMTAKTLSPQGGIQGGGHSLSKKQKTQLIDTYWKNHAIVAASKGGKKYLKKKGHDKKNMDLNETPYLYKRANYIMEKLAGFGWDLRAYNVDPSEFEANFVNPRRKSGKWSDKKRAAQGKYPSSRKLKYKMFGGKKRYSKAVDKWHAKGKEFKAKNPNPVDTDKMYKWKRGKEIHKNFKTNYKLNNNMDFDTESGGGAGMLHGAKGSDFWNSNSPTVNFMTKDDLKTVVKNYKSKMKEYGPRQSTDRSTYKVKGKDGKLRNETFPSSKENFDKGTKAFLSKADTILKDPKAKTILLEWE